MKSIAFAVLLAAPLFFETAAHPAEPRVVHVRLAVKDPLAHIPDLQRLARTMESAPGVTHVEVDASRARLEVTLRDGVESEALLEVAQRDGFGTESRPNVAVR